MQVFDRPATEFDPFSDDFLTDPYPFHERLREHGPVTYLERYGVYAVARHADVVATLADWETFCSSAGVGLSDFRKNAPWRPPSLILEADPPLHTRTHRVLLRVLSPAVLRDLRPAFEAAADELVEHILTRAAVDGIADIALVYPLKVFPDAIGVRADGRENLLPYGNMVFNAFGPQNERFTAAVADAQRVIGWIDAACERDALAPDGIGARVYDAVESGEVTYDEARLLVRSLLSAGLDTTVNALGNALVCFANAPEQWEILRSDPTLARTAFDEVMRFESPVQTFFRTTTRDVDVDGVPIGANEKVLLFFAAANRDPRRWENPDEFHITRRSGGHVGFGHGVHRCVGEMLAKVEGEILLAALARRVERIASAGAPLMRLNNTLRGYERLPLELT
ncbi:MAG: cytochrome P450 [Candidatus Velthaea sp.]